MHMLLHFSQWFGNSQCGCDLCNKVSPMWNFLQLLVVLAFAMSFYKDVNYSFPNTWAMVQQYLVFIFTNYYWLLDPSAKSIYCFAYELKSQITCKNEVKYLTSPLDSQFIDLRYAKTVAKIKDLWKIMESSQMPLGKQPKQHTRFLD